MSSFHGLPDDLTSVRKNIVRYIFICSECVLAYMNSINPFHIKSPFPGAKGIILGKK